MKKFIVLVVLSVLLSSVTDLAGLMLDKKLLQDQIIRLHVVAQSDAKVDQNIKLCVKDAIVSYLQEHIPKNIDAASARIYLSAHLSTLENVANAAIEAAGGSEFAVVSLRQEAFPKRDYDTFSLPSGVYESLRVTIGDGKGKNWWCVVFPSLCAGSTTDEYKSLAVSAGLSESVVSAMAGEEEYMFRFFLLDCLGKLENFFHFR